MQLVNKEAGERRSFKSALATALEDLELSFSLRKEQRTALKSSFRKGRCVQSFTDRIRRMFNQLVPLHVALVGCSTYCVQREFERQPFITPLGLSPVNGESESTS